MALLRKNTLVFPATAALMIMLGSCEFHPNLKDIGYPACIRDSDCPSKGLVCWEGICLAECQGADPVVWIKLDAADIGEYTCPGLATCEKLDRLKVQLPPGSYIEMGPERGQVDPACELLLARFTLVPMRGVDQAKLSVMILGLDDQDQEVMGVVPTPIDLGREHLDRAYVINPETFAWPVRVRLVASESDVVAHFEIEEYRLLCCEKGL